MNWRANPVYKICLSPPRWAQYSSSILILIGYILNTLLEFIYRPFFVLLYLLAVFTHALKILLLDLMYLCLLIYLVPFLTDLLLTLGKLACCVNRPSVTVMYFLVNYFAVILYCLRDKR